MSNILNEISEELNKNLERLKFVGFIDDKVNN